MIVENKDSKLPPAIQVENLTVSYGPVPALLDISVSIPAGQLVGVIGPNGSGKSTLIKSILGFVKPEIGSIELFGQDVALAKGKVAYVPQRGSVDWDFPITVREVAVMGRYGHRRWWLNLSREDYRHADEALDKVRMSEFRQRQIGQLSGGQQQRVFLRGAGPGRRHSFARRAVCRSRRGDRARDSGRSGGNQGSRQDVDRGPSRPGDRQRILRPVDSAQAAVVWIWTARHGAGSSIIVRRLRRQHESLC